jgi:hypothetical protein
MMVEKTSAYRTPSHEKRVDREEDKRFLLDVCAGIPIILEGRKAG